MAWPCRLPCCFIPLAEGPRRCCLDVVRLECTVWRGEWVWVRLWRMSLLICPPDSLLLLALVRAWCRCRSGVRWLRLALVLLMQVKLLLRDFLLLPFQFLFLCFESLPLLVQLVCLVLLLLPFLLLCVPAKLLIL